jgi:predicted unusual protein kinase regulating ubiquinone biosynthesis (AarF/ABC1/UbiB family)
MEMNRFVMYDLGHIVQLDKTSRSLMKILVFEIMTENIEGVIAAMEKMPEIIKIRDKTKVRVFVKQYIEYVKTIDVQVLSSLDSRDDNLPVQFSSTVFEIVRIFGIIEGICLSLDPTFQYDKVFYKYIDTLVLDRDFLEYKAGTDLAKIWKWIT